MSLGLSLRHGGDTITVCVSGDIDLRTAAQLEDAFAGQTGGSAATVVVDLTEVEFVDSAGINALLKGQRGAQSHGQAFRISGTRPLVRQVLEMTGVWDLLSGHER
ncbi:hypothetical protein Val02_48640 [Virgisporangium aliadipatigenens]|uniref:Anti-sigma factor antagonist n=1 Tax=Virgisporangium aliadipatigenens TaxID=741659 RepID=A0A8J3YQJ9_9ACTN|nr:STAS domain-containing protein [Virgisporangium aliadipatigenens]GIJ47978.1 hypothetical protein Val02_48640 [Virgisporangium aliadipatigenens]